MLFFPKGVKNGEVVDPDRLSQDFIEASRISGETSHYQWAQDTFDQRVKLEAGTHVNIINNRKHARLQISQVADPIVGRGVGTTDVNLWQIPLDRGMLEIGDGDIRAEWVADVPELVMICYTIQYYMPEQPEVNAIFGGATHRLRFRSAIELDGSLLSGTGPYGSADSIKGIRGAGFAHTSLGVSATTVQFLEAGAHSATVVAGIARPEPYLLSTNVEPYDYKVDQQGKNLIGFVIASRNLIVMRFGRGCLLGA
jgi:hypothetical protein